MLKPRLSSIGISGQAFGSTLGQCPTSPLKTDHLAQLPKQREVGREGSGTTLGLHSPEHSSQRGLSGHLVSAETGEWGWEYNFLPLEDAEGVDGAIAFRHP